MIVASQLQSASSRAAALRWMDRWVDPLLLFLAAATVPILILETADLDPTDERMITVGNWIVWAAFLVNFCVRVGLAPDRSREARELRWDLLVVFGQPLLLLGHLVSGAALVRVLVVASRAMARGAVFQREWRKLRHEPMRVVAGLAPFVWLTSSALLLRTERDTGAVQSIGDALWWGAATLTTVGYGDVAPRTGAGRTIAVVTMVSGIGMFSLVTAKLAEALVTRRTTEGRSPVVASDHTVVLGWSSQVFTIVNELLLANDDRESSTVVVLADLDHHDMERQILEHVPALVRSNTTLLCRTGSPTEPANFPLAVLELARSIIVLGDGQGDAKTVKTLLALLNRDDVGSAPVVAEMSDPGTASSLLEVFPARLELVDPASFIARVTAQACRVPGVAVAYEELLSFRGSEFYVHREPAAAGLPFGDLLHAFADACVIGLHHPDGTTTLRPPFATTVGADDRLVVIARSANQITWTGPAAPPEVPVPGGAPRPPQPELIVVCGWNRSGAAIVEELDLNAPPGSQITVLVDDAERGAVEQALTDLETRRPVAIRSDSGSRHTGLLRTICSVSDHVVILCPRDAASVAEADARALLTMLTVRETQRRVRPEATLVTELLDERDVDLAPRSRAGDFIVSERLVSLLLTQVAENRHLAGIFTELVAAWGNDVHCRPVDRYLRVPCTTTFDGAVAAAARHDELAIGYRKVAQADDPVTGFGIVINPRRDEPVELGPEDQLIVIGAGDRRGDPAR